MAEPLAAPESLWDDLANTDALRAYQTVGGVSGETRSGYPFATRPAAASGGADPGRP